MSRLDLGVGLALMPGLVDELDHVDHLIDCLEVEPQTFWLETDDAAAPFRMADDEVEALRRRFGVLTVHGVSTPVGGTCPPNPAMAELFAHTAHALGAVLASEHLSFNQVAGPSGEIGSAFFLPPCQSGNGVDVAVDSIGILRRRLPMPFLVETPVSYLRPRPGEMADGAFMAEVATRADCGILLDLHNVWANQINGRQAARAYVDQLPLDRVWEVHLAGGFLRREFWLDAHSGGLHPALLELAEEVIPRLPNVRVITYEILPEFVRQGGVNVLRRDLETVHRLVDRCQRRSTNRGQEHAHAGPAAPSSDRATVDPLAAATWEATLMTALTGAPTSAADTTLADSLASDPGMALLTELVAAGRSGRIGSSLPLTTGLLLVRDGIEVVERLFADYAQVHPPQLFGAAEGRAFGRWIVETKRDQLVNAAVAIDLAALDSVQTGTPVTIEVAVDPMALIAAVHHGAPLPVVPPERRRRMIRAEIGSATAVSSLASAS